MVSIQSYIRAEVSHGVFPTPKGAETFSAYAIASANGLVPETENAAHQTLDHPMTFEILGEGLRLFEGCTLRDLANLRKRYRDNLVSCFDSFLKPEESLCKIWTPCAAYDCNRDGNSSSYYNRGGSSSYSRTSLPMFNANKNLPTWLGQLFQKHLDESCDAFSNPLFNPRNIQGEYLSALHAHINSNRCISCTHVHALKGETFCKDLEDRLTQALNKVCSSSVFWRNDRRLCIHPT